MDTAAGILVVAALVGLSMVILRLRGRPRPPTWLALSHGGVAVTGVGTLAFVGMKSGLPTLAWAAFVVFLAAALGGLTMFLLFHLKNRALPIGLMLVHALAALTGVTMLLIAVNAEPAAEPLIPPAPPAGSRRRPP